MAVYIGTSGWQYKHWRPLFYPRGMQPSQELRYYAERFQTVEVNATFYRLPQAEVFAKWYDETPDDWVFAVKASQFLSHFKRLKNPEEPVDRLMTRAVRLKHKLGPVLVQLPARFHAAPDRLADTLKAFPPETRVAFEFRHESWFTDEVQEILRIHQAALCWADSGSRLACPPWKTTGWGYFRFHFGTSSPPSCYEPAVLEERARLLANTWKPEDDLFVYFNNDAHGCALQDAYRFARMMEALGWRATRAPQFELEVPVQT